MTAIYVNFSFLVGLRLLGLGCALAGARFDLTNWVRVEGFLYRDIQNVGGR